jgi:MFS family permease
MRFLAKTWPQIIWISALSNEDRVKGLSLHRTITSTAGIIAPLISAYIITYFGGLGSADNIRPLFLMQFVVSIITFVLLVTQLKEVSFTRKESKTSVFNYFFNVLNEVPGLKFLLLRQIVQTLISHMRMPFSGIYMVDVKGATALILGWRGTVSTAIVVLLSIPAGRLADRFGRRKTAYYSRIFGWAAILITIFTPLKHPEYLIIASFLQGIQSALFIGWTAFNQEYIPLEIRGRWNGLSMLSHGIIGTIAPILGGLIWNMNPDYIWWINLFGDALLVLPLMILIPDIKKRTPVEI